MRKVRRRNASSGFTLIELLIVIAIIGILASVAIVIWFSARSRAQTTAAEQYLVNIYKVANAFLAEDAGNDLVPGATVCDVDYVAGAYSVESNGLVLNCLFTVAPDRSISITADSLSGTPVAVP